MKAPPSTSHLAFLDLHLNLYALFLHVCLLFFSGCIRFLCANFDCPSSLLQYFFLFHPFLAPIKPVAKSTATESFPSSCCPPLSHPLLLFPIPLPFAYYPHLIFKIWKHQSCFVVWVIVKSFQKQWCSSDVKRPNVCLLQISVTAHFEWQYSQSHHTGVVSCWSVFICVYIVRQYCKHKKIVIWLTVSMHFLIVSNE